MFFWILIFTLFDVSHTAFVSEIFEKLFLQRIFCVLYQCDIHRHKIEKKSQLVGLLGTLFNQTTRQIVDLGWAPKFAKLTVVFTINLTLPNSVIIILIYYYRQIFNNKKILFTSMILDNFFFVNDQPSHLVGWLIQPLVVGLKYIRTVFLFTFSNHAVIKSVW